MPKAGPTASTTPSAASPVTPAPHATLVITDVTIPAGTVYHRIHHQQFGATDLNPGLGNARFSPIQDAAGAQIPTIYAATTLDAAAMESVYHEVPFEPGFKRVDKAKLKDQVHSTVESTSDLKLADLGSIALRKLGVKRAQLIDTDADQYPLTRKWAEAIHAAAPDIQGLSWVSRQDDSARAVVLFGDRIAPGVLQQQGTSRSLSGDQHAYSKLLDLADRLGVRIT